MTTEISIDGIGGYFCCRSSSSINNDVLEQIQAILRPSKATAGAGSATITQTCAPRRRQPRLQIVDFVTDVMQSATLS